MDSRLRPLCSILLLLLGGCLLAPTGTVASEPLGPSSRRTGLVISEIMFHPLARTDGKNSEFVELYNSEAVPANLSGYRLSGDLDFIFPTNTILPGLGFVVIAAVPADVQTIYGLVNVLGPLGNGTNSLPNDAARIRLRSKSGAVLLEVNYADASPWPTAADGAGHSIVLARPSLGEGDPAAWAPSVFAGGSPGTMEPADSDPLRFVVINEFLAHTDDPEVDYIELYNHSNQPIDVSGCVLTDDPLTNRFVLPANTTIPARGFVHFTQTNLSFSLSAAGETIYLRNAARTRVIDAVRFGGQENGVATGRYPDGADQFYPLTSKTPGAPNAAIRASDIVINELMYHPINGDDDEQYVEIYNRGATTVNLGGWKLADAISFTFPTNTMLPPDRYLVVARDAAHLLTNYSLLTTNNTLGDFKGALSSGGERLALTMPDTIVVTNSTGVVETNAIHITMDDVTYQTGGRWPQWSDGGGSSLERIDARANSRLASTWADSDETTKAPWTLIESTGVLDNGSGTPDQLQILLQGAGECLVDDVEVLNSGSMNVIANSSFEAGATGWTAEGTQDQTTLESAEGFNSAQSLHVRAVERGDTGANRIRTSLTTSLTPGVTGTIRAKARWLRGHPELLLRLRGNYLEAIGRLNLPPDPGTPGARNSRALANAGPAIYSVTHSPILPAASQAVVVNARVEDPQVLASVQLLYRLDPTTTYTTVNMVDNGTGGDAIAGDGIYSATIPGQTSGTLVAFYVQATDTFSPAATTRFPADAPTREALVRFGDTQPAGSFGTYRLWMTQATVTKWTNRSKLNNTPLDVTFVYNNQRAIYNMNALFAGSPYISPGYNTPTGNLCGYTGSFPEDDRFLGTRDFVLDWPGRDNTAIEEPLSYWIADQIGLPNSYRRFIHLHVNGVTDQTRGSVYEDVQQPGSDMIKEWAPDDTDGDFYKIERWFEFSDTVSLLSDTQPRLQNYTTTGGQKKLARYRWNWLPRAVKDSVNDYTNLFALVDAANAPGPEPYTSQTESLADVEEMMGIFAVEHIINNFDSWGHEIGKNMYAYKPQNGRWMTFMFDIDWVMKESSGHNGYSPTSPLFTPTEDPVVARMYDHPPFRRAYFRAIKKAVDGPLVSTTINPLMDAKYNALVANGVTRSAGQTLVAPTAVKTWISQRRDYLVQQLAAIAAPFVITSNNGGDFSANTNVIILTGTAPIEVTSLRVNGEEYPVAWSSVTNWSLQLVLSRVTNPFALEALNADGAVITGGTDSISVTFTGPSEQPQDHVVINEIMYNPAVPNASFVELFNTSATTTFDLSGWRLDGAGFAFAPGTLIAPGGFAVVAKDRAVFAATYGASIPLVGEFTGQLKNDGETLRLIKPGTTTSEDQLIDEIAYSDSSPWPAAADGVGSSLQLIDPNQDNSRVASWTAAAAASNNVPPQTLIVLTNVWRYDQSGVDLSANWTTANYDDSLWPSGQGLLYVEDAVLPAPKSTPLTIGRTTYYFRTHFNFTGDPTEKVLQLSTVIDDGAVFYLNGVEVYRLGMPTGPITYTNFTSRLVGDAAYEGPLTLPSTGLRSGDNVLAVEVHQNNSGSSDIAFGMTLDATVPSSNPAYTPGAPNSVLANLPPFPALWLNELQPSNITGITDNVGDRDPWVELFNAGTNAIDLSGYHLTDSYTNLTRWAFPTNARINPGQFLLVWLDGEPGEATANSLHASFRVPPDTGSLAVVFPLNAQPTVLDYLTYDHVPADRSVGFYPDGQSGQRSLFYYPSPGGTNNNASPPTPLFINEWMAANTGTLANPLGGQFDDWFEIFNPNGVPVDLTGYSLTDTLTNAASRWTVPAGTMISPNGFLLIWADNQADLNGTNGGDVHANFKLSQTGEAIGLFAPNGSLVDSVVFGAQTNDVSGGRWPDGGANIYFMSTPTPVSANVISGNPPPPLEFVSTVLDGNGNLVITWSAETGKTYRVQYKDDLTTSTWSNLRDVPATGPFASTSDATGPAPHRFYRIQRLSP